MTQGHSLLQIRDLTVRYRRRRGQPPVTAVRDVSLSVDAGETVALVGESGAGKTTVGNVVLGLVAASAGSVTFDGEDITRASPRRRRLLTAHIQAVFQDPYGSLNPARTIGQTLTEPLRAHHDCDAAAARRQVAAALDLVGLSGDAARRYPAEFSGGQRQRIAIARALVVRPRLIVCDEPTSALDLSIQAQVLNLLRQLQRDLGVSYLFITHNLPVVRHVARRLVVMYRGQVMESGPAGEVCDDPGHPYTQALTAAAPVPDPAEQRARRDRYRATVTALWPESTQGCAFASRCPWVYDACLLARPPLVAAAGRQVSCLRYSYLPAAESSGRSHDP
jgi:peptide/nickel transport system ATP-binding protein